MLSLSNRHRQGAGFFLRLGCRQPGVNGCGSPGLRRTGPGQDRTRQISMRRGQGLPGKLQRGSSSTEFEKACEALTSEENR